MKKVFTVTESVKDSGDVHFEWQKMQGNYLAVYGTSPRVSVYDRHGEFVYQIVLDGRCEGMDWEHQGDVLAVIDNKSTSVQLWDVHQEKVTRIETGFKDTPSLVLWSRQNSRLAVGTSKGNLLMYGHLTSSRTPVLGKHSRRITCGAWSEEGLLVLGSEDRTFTLSNEAGETVRQIPVRDLVDNLQFSTGIKDDERSSIRDNTISCVLGKKTLFLFRLTDMDNPIELAFQEKYGSIVDYKWYGDGYVMIGFSNGHFVVISTHKKEIGQELHQNREYKDSLSSIGVSLSLSKAVTVGDRNVKFYDLGNLKEVTAIIELEEEGAAQGSRWSEDGQLLAVSVSSGSVHVFLTRLPVLASVSSDGARLAYLTSLREVSVVQPGISLIPQSTPKVLQIELEPKFIGVGPHHLGLGMNNQAWFYRDTADGYKLVSEQEYMKTVSMLQLNSRYSCASYDGKITLQTIEPAVEGENRDNRRDRKIFPDQSHATEAITSCQLTSNFLVYSTDKGNLNIFFMEDWNYASEFKHHCGIMKVFSNDSGTSIVFMDTKTNSYLFSPLDENIIEIPDFPAGTKKILWDFKSEENSLMLVCTEDRLYTYMVHRFYVDAAQRGSPIALDKADTVIAVNRSFSAANGDVRGGRLPVDQSVSEDDFTTNSHLTAGKISLVGFTKLPFGHKPLYLCQGDIVMLNQSGKLVTNTLGTHSFKQGLRKLQDMQFDEMVQHFQQAIVVNYFQEAWKISEVLKSEKFWVELAQAALKCIDIEFAIRVYRKLSDVGMVFSLLKIRDIEDRHLLGGYVAMFLGDYVLAQDMFLNSSYPIAALNMRRDLLHWDSALQLAKALAPAQIAFISREYAGQLEFIGDYVNAKMNYERGLTNNAAVDEGGLEEHIHACTTGIARMSIRIGDSKRGIMMAEKSNNKTLMKECAIILEQTKLPTEAAALYERAGLYDKAIIVYVRLKQWDRVGQLLTRSGSPKLHLLYAKAREAEGRYQDAVAAYEVARDFDSVIRLSLDPLKNVDEAVRIVQATGSREGAHLVAQYFIGRGEFASALEFLVMSKCLGEAFRLAQDHGQMDTYAKIIGPDATMEDYLNIANYFDYQKHHHNAGKFYLLACQYEKAIRHLLKVPYEDDSVSVELAIRAVGLANDDKLTRFLVDYLLGELDSVPKNMKYLFQMYMALKQFREAARTAVLIAREEQTNGNYRTAHDLLFGMMRQLRQNDIRVPSEMSSNLMLLHSYIIAKVHIKRGDHLKGARMLIRVAESISKFPAHVVPILTSTVIECHRAGLRESSLSYAAMLLRPEYRDQVDARYRKKMENIVRKPDRSQLDESHTACPFCTDGGGSMLPETQLHCHQCKNGLPYCIATGRHIIKEDLVLCPNCEFPAIGSELRILLSEPDAVCPMCSETVAQDQLRQVIDVSRYLTAEGSD